MGGICCSENESKNHDEGIDESKKMTIRAGENSFQKQFLEKYEDESSEEDFLQVKKKSTDDAKQPEAKKLEKQQKLRKMVTDRSDFSTEALVQKLKEQTLKNLKNSIR